MAKKEMTYEEAMACVEEIVGRIQREEVSVDRLAAEVERATELLETCRARLLKAEAEVNKIVE
ncbi:MAG: exodeoxyribonuclease VII small subunit [Alistipes sp.]|nr:exodeoxyribonuclease VII small subunit [Alistipes senegalensis]MCM1249757.1 exodeoxyribonuclease VII small subunit [Alistipes sp.]